MTIPAAITYVIVYIFEPFQIGIVQHGTDLNSCLEKAAKSIGEPMQVMAWDNMGGSNPLPKIVAAFCAAGISTK